MFGKLFQTIYDGTLASNGPWQALVTFQQLIILADQDGNVDMTPQAIARRTSLPLDLIELGIRELMKPDPFSRTPDEEGRRIVFLEDSRPWGWRVVNYAKYRDLRKAEDRREYLRVKQQESRERRARLADGVSTTVNTASTKINTSTHTEADTEAEVEEKKTTSPALPAGFVRFWNEWPSHPRKAAKRQCLAKWKALDCESIADEIVTAVAAHGKSRAWQKDAGDFIPAPLVWLNQQRWEAPTEAQAVAEQQAASWRDSRAGIDAKAVELGLKPWADYERDMMSAGKPPLYPTFRAEIFRAAA